MSAGERARVARLKIPDLRESLTRTLIARRLWLARHFNVAPETITIDYDGAGAPRIQGWAPGELSFSRSEDWCAIACARARKVGIDIEVERDRDWPSILNFLSTPEEAEHIRHAVRSAGSLTPFYRTWCTKEAVLKVMGTGFKAGPKIINLPSAMLDGASEFDIALANGTARVGVETFETVTVALATARL